MDSQKEEFCAPCIAGIAAMSGAGSSMTMRKNSKLFWITLIITVIAIIFLVYSIWFSGECGKCSRG